MRSHSHLFSFSFNQIYNIKWGSALYLDDRSSVVELNHTYQDDIDLHHGHWFSLVPAGDLPPLNESQDLNSSSCLLADYPSKISMAQATSCYSQSVASFCAEPHSVSLWGPLWHTTSLFWPERRHLEFQGHRVKLEVQGVESEGNLIKLKHPFPPHLNHNLEWSTK